MTDGLSSTDDVIETKARAAFECYELGVSKFMGPNWLKRTWPELPLRTRAVWCAVVQTVLGS